MKKQNVRTLSFIVMTFTYLLIGAAIFNALESENEDFTRQNLTDSERKYKSEYHINDTDYSELEEIVIKYHAYRTYPQWKFTGALYFSLTVITTIGYGHSTPQTKEGKIFCMVYAIIGIPLCLVMYQSLGERLNYLTSYTLQFVKKCIKCRKREVTQTEMVTITGVFASIVIAGGAAMFRYYEKWNYFDSIYYCVITLTTIGFGDYVALQNDLSNITYVIFTFTFIILGLTVVASTLNLLVLKFLTMNTDDERKECEINRKSTKDRSNSDFLSVNGDLLCSFEPNDLDDLKTANSFKICFPTRQKHFSNLTRNFTTFFTHKNENLKSKSCFSNLNNINNNMNTNSNLNIKTLKSSNKPKNHYTIRRGPGKISHLLIPQRLDLILTQSNVNQLVTKHESIKSQNNSSSQEENLESFDNINNNTANCNNSNNNHDSTSDLYKLNRTTSLTFDVNLYIDEEESQQDVYQNTNNLRYDNNATTITNKSYKKESLSNEDKYSLRSNDLVKTTTPDAYDSSNEFSNKYYRKDIFLSK